MEKKKSRVLGRGKLRETKREGERPGDRGGEKQRGRIEREPESSVRAGDRETPETRDPEVLNPDETHQPVSQKTAGDPSSAISGGLRSVSGSPFRDLFNTISDGLGVRFPVILGNFRDLADGYGLLKLGGSDYHGRGGHGEFELGSVNLPVLDAHDFLKVAWPIWCCAILDNLERYAEEPSDSNLAKITRFGRTPIFKGGSPLSCGKDLIDRCLPLWLTNEERQNANFEAIRLKLSNISINQGGLQVPIESK